MGRKQTRVSQNVPRTSRPLKSILLAWDYLFFSRFGFVYAAALTRLNLRHYLTEVEAEKLPSDQVTLAAVRFTSLAGVQNSKRYLRRGLSQLVVLWGWICLPTTPILRSPEFLCENRPGIRGATTEGGESTSGLLLGLCFALVVTSS